MSSLGTSKGILEVAKFAIYVTVPVALTYAFVTDSGTLHKLMGFIGSALLHSTSIAEVRAPFIAESSISVLAWENHHRPYVVYPPEGPPPPSPEELREMAKEIARKNESNRVRHH
ncbi:hypothetical protein KSP40_PGU018205 [Platanthera guangdongensis]|uniref:Uncharacterized protein n=1 Tax=Platanthera guangdongensis TaxID=2320717 RepID=A0ABR2LMC6_9ASPA